MRHGLSREEIIEQSAQVVQSGRLALLTSSEPDILSGLLGDVAIWMMEAGADVIRVDAFEAHTATDLVDRLCSALGLPAVELFGGLRLRGETGNPVCLVIDNGDCLDAKGLKVLRDLSETTACGAGILLAGESDLGLFIADAGLAPSWSLFLDEHELSTVPDEDDSAGVMASFPWRHLAAAAGLGLLVMLFWPRGEEPTQVRELVLPPQPRSVADVAPDTEREPVRQQTRHTDEDVAEPAAEVVPTPPTAPEVAVTPEPPPEPSARPAPEPVRPVPAPAPSRPAAEPAVKSRPSAPVAPALRGLAAELGYRVEDWLLAQPPRQWMLQVALATSEDAARSLLDRLGRDRGAYYRTVRNGRTVYIVLAGPWADREAAVAGKKGLPADVQALGPFPRQMDPIQQEISATP